MSKMEKCAGKNRLPNHSKTTEIANDIVPVQQSKDDRLVAELRSQIPDVNNIFNIHRRIGEGTFSNVFLASLKCHDHVPQSKRKLFAVKHLIPTSHPHRVERELKCLLEIGGIDNVVGVELCLRRNEAIAFVMPYVPHDRFHDYFDKMSARDLQMYMRNIIVALRRVHQFGIIHRDVKPSNFLHDRKNQRYLLVDFGLAQNVNNDVINSATPDTAAAAAATAATAAVTGGGGEQRTNNGSRITLPENGSNSKKRKASTNGETENSGKRARLEPNYSENAPQRHAESAAVMTTAITANPNNIPSPFKSPLKQSNEIVMPKNTKSNFDSALTRQIKSAVLGYSMNVKLEQQQQNRNRNRPVGGQQSATIPTNDKYNSTKNQRKESLNSNGSACYCYGKPTVCNICIVKKEIHASRAGTPGYRPPEVLLKYPNQTTAVDIWAAGVIMISIVSGCYPFFKGTDDFSALAEMITVFGDEIIRKTAFQLSRHICISCKKQPLHLRKLCIRLRNNRKIVRLEKPNKNENFERSVSGGGNGGGVGVGVGGTDLNATLLSGRNCENCQQAPNECLCANSPLNMNFSCDIYPESAYDLLAKLLAINPKVRITAEQALEHQFFKENL